MYFYAFCFQNCTIQIYKYKLQAFLINFSFLTFTFTNLHLVYEFRYLNL